MKWSHFLEYLQDLTSLLLFISSIIFQRQLKLTKWKRKLSKGEMTMYVITSLTIPIYGITYLLLLLGT